MKKNIKVKLIVFLFITALVYSCTSQAIESEADPTSNITLPSTTVYPTPDATLPSTNIAYPTPKVYPFNRENFVHLAWFYKPPDPDQINSLVQNFDLFILTHKDEAVRDQLRSMGVNSPIFQYLLLTEIRRPDTCDENNHGNQVAYQKGDFCLIKDQHLDWFLLDKSGNPIHADNTTYFMDPGNPEFRKFWLQRAHEMQAQYGWDGLFIDNVEASLSKIRQMGLTTAKYPNDSSYQSAVEGFLVYLRENNPELNKRLMIANIVSVSEDEVWIHYIENLDGAMIESFAVDWSTGYKSAPDWEQQMDTIEKALALGKILILVSQGRQYDDVSREQFAFASYLLVSNGNTAFRYANSENYRDIWLYENLYIDPGLPLGPRYREGEAWRRDFTNGYVLVNPWTNSSQLEFIH